MKVCLVVLAAVVLDRCLGEPRRFHPLVGFGRLAAGVEALVYGPVDASREQRRRRGALALGVAVVPVVGLVIALVSRETIALLVEILIVYLALGAKSLSQHANAVSLALREDHPDHARAAVARMVSRDTDAMTATDVSRAAIESVLENGTDAVFATLFWYVLAGAPGAAAHRMINTLDAMWGYRNKRYIDFGWAVARLDDLLNWIPARLTAFTYGLCNGRSAHWRQWRRDAQQWSSPNAGMVMAAGAHALDLRLGGPASYHGILVRQRPWLGAGRRPEAGDIQRAVRLIDHGILVWIAAIAVFALIDALL